MKVALVSNLIRLSCRANSRLFSPDWPILEHINGSASHAVRKLDTNIATVQPNSSCKDRHAHCPTSALPFYKEERNYPSPSNPILVQPCQHSSPLHRISVLVSHLRLMSDSETGIGGTEGDSSGGADLQRFSSLGVASSARRKVLLLKRTKIAQSDFIAVGQDISTDDFHK